MVTTEQRKIIEYLKEQKEIKIKVKDLDISIKDRICIHSIALSIQSNFSRDNERTYKKTGSTSKNGRRNNVVF